jgi:uncharacterized protein (TIGR02186 family)
MSRPPTRTAILLALLTLVLLAPGERARAEALAADLSKHLIAITTAFVGTEVVLFGTSDGQGDIVVTVHGPRQDTVVWRKDRIAGIWLNRNSIEFAQVPDYYAIAASGPLNRIARPDVRARLELGVEYLKLEPRDTGGREVGEIATFEDALVRNKQRQRLYSEEPGDVNFIGPRLFRTTLNFPANVQPGIYQVQVFELEDGQITDAQRSTLVISKVGVEADIFDFAQQESALYGLTAIIVAVVSGWLAGVIFRRA